MWCNFLNSKKAGTVGYLFNGIAILLIFLSFLYFIIASRPSSLVAGFDEREVKSDTIIFNFNNNCINEDSNLILKLKNDNKASCIVLDDKSFLKGWFEKDSNQDIKNIVFYAGNKTLEKDEDFCDYEGSIFCFDEKIPVIDSGEFKVLHLKGILK